MYTLSASVPDTVPVFPLPDVVLFPGQLLPLHVFEPRYRSMTADALRGERLIAIAQLRPGFEESYFTRRAPVHRVVGVGRIIASEELPDGKYHILLHGRWRGCLVRETRGRPYRVARISALDTICGASPAEVRSLRRELCGAIEVHLSDCRGLDGRCRVLFAEPLSLGELTDRIAGALPMHGGLGQRLLAERCACRRVRLLLDYLPRIGAQERHRQDHARRYELNLN